MIASPILTAIKEAAQYVGKKLDDLSSAVNAGAKVDLSEPINAQTRSLSSAVLRIEQAIDKIKDPKFSGEVVVDTSSLEKAIGEIKKSLKEPNLSSIEKALHDLYMCVESKGEKQAKALAEGLSEIASSLKEISLEVPSTFKLDEMQVRVLANSGGGMVMNPAPLVARSVTQTNLALTSTATEYSHTFPANTLSWVVKLRDQGTLAYYSFTTGKLPTVGGGGDGTKYTTIPQNFLRSQDGVDWSGKTIYFGAESNSQVAEIETYQG